MQTVPMPMPMTASVRIESTGSLVVTSNGLQQRDEQALADFSNDLEAALRDLEASFKTRELAGKNVAKLKKTLDEQNWWGTLKSSFSGEADKNLATMVEDLGTSLGLTQSALRVILKVQTEKNRMLRGFSDALVSKIFKVQQDTHTLDGNQKAAALNFLQELQTQIDEQIRQQDLVDSHEAALQEHAQWRHGQAQAHANLVNRIDQLHADTLGTQRRADAFDVEIAALRQQLASLATGQAQAHANLANRIDQMHADTLGTQRRVDAFDVEIAALRQQLASLAAENQRLGTPKAVLLRNLVPLAASLIAVFALFMSMKG